MPALIRSLGPQSGMMFRWNSSGEGVDELGWCLNEISGLSRGKTAEFKSG